MADRTPTDPPKGRQRRAGASRSGHRHLRAVGSSDDAQQPRCAATTARGEPCKKPAAAGADRCRIHLGGKVGRRATLTPEVTAKIVQVVASGGYVETAIGVAGIARTTYFRWIERGDPDRARKEDAPYREFRAQIEKAKADGETTAVALIARAAAKDWKAAAWMLERQHPERWGGPRSRLLQSAPEDHGGQSADDAVDSLFVDDQVGPDGRPL